MSQVKVTDLVKMKNYNLLWGYEIFKSKFMNKISCRSFGFKYVFVCYNNRDEPFMAVLIRASEISERVTEIEGKK